MGMRLSGIEGVVVHTSEEVSNALDKAMEMKYGIFKYGI